MPNILKSFKPLRLRMPTLSTIRLNTAGKHPSTTKDGQRFLITMLSLVGTEDKETNFSTSKKQSLLRDPGTLSGISRKKIGGTL